MYYEIEGTNPISLDIDCGVLLSHQVAVSFIGKEEGSSKYSLILRKRIDGIDAPSTIPIVKDTIDLFLKISFAVFSTKLSIIDLVLEISFAVS